MSALRLVSPIALLALAQPSAALAGGFAELLPSLPCAITDALSARGIHTPTPIQAAALPRIAAGESVLLHAETGSGKSLAFLLPSLMRLGPGERVLVVAPTRELAVQLANEATELLLSPREVQIIAIGVTPTASALFDAKLVACTAPEVVALLDADEDATNALDQFFLGLRVIVLDELDSLIPVDAVYGPNAAMRKRRDNKKVGTEPDAQVLLRRVLEVCAAPELQLLAASATASRPTRLKLARILRRDPVGRWYNKPPHIVRPLELEGQDLSKLSRAVVVPSVVKHMYLRVAGKMPKDYVPLPAKRVSSKRKITLKQKRQLKLNAKKAAEAAARQQELHPLLAVLSTALEQLQPSSALVFLCRSSGLTVRRASKQLSAIGLDATPLHEAIGLEHADGREPITLRGRSGGEELFGGEEQLEEDLDQSELLLQRHRLIAERFRAQRSGASAGASQPAGAASDGAPAAGCPLVVTFEDMARGLHFDGVDFVFILGVPDSPATYQHLAGRTGRCSGGEGPLEGTVVTLCPGKGYEQLLSWRERLGSISIEELKLEGDADAADATTSGEPSEAKSRAPASPWGG